jgi:ribonuclease HI
MEMIAVLEAIKYVEKEHTQTPIEIFSDSNLIVQTINKGWKKKANQDLWVQIEKRLPKINFTIEWVKAHANNHYNNICDELAYAKAQKAQKEIQNKPWLKKQEISDETKKPATDESEQASLF